MKKYIFGFVVLFLSITTITSAHVVVRPSTAGVGTYQTFTVAVPTEKDLPTVELRVIIPEGIENVTPNVKTGWRVEVRNNIDGENGQSKELHWVGGSIPAGQRDEFVFSAKMPSVEKTLPWKAYQIYSDGSVVAWSQNPKEATGEGTKPYSETTVINDIKDEESSSTLASSNSTPVVFSILALTLSIIALGKTRNRMNV